MSTLAVLQPSFLPWLGYFDQMVRADTFIYYDDVQFDKHGWRNRNRIKSLTGEPSWLTVPTRHKNQGKPLIKDIRINNDEPWSRKQLGTIKQFYGKAPYFEQYWPTLSQLLAKNWDFLIDLNLESTAWLLSVLGIKCTPILSSSLNIQGDKSERLVNFCKEFKANKYLSGDAAQAYLDCELFAANGVDVVWQRYQHPEYPQMHGTFVPYLSIIDLLLNVGPECGGYFIRPNEGET